MEPRAWVPGEGDELVARVQAAIAQFLEDTGTPRAWVLVEL
jgi:hypothetical protein